MHALVAMVDVVSQGIVIDDFDITEKVKAGDVQDVLKEIANAFCLNKDEFRLFELRDVLAASLAPIRYAVEIQHLEKGNYDTWRYILGFNIAFYALTPFPIADLTLAESQQCEGLSLKATEERLAELHSLKQILKSGNFSFRIYFGTYWAGCVDTIPSLQDLDAIPRTCKPCKYCNHVRHIN